MKKNKQVMLHEENDENKHKTNAKETIGREVRVDSKEVN